MILNKNNNNKNNNNNNNNQGVFLELLVAAKNIISYRNPLLPRMPCGARLNQNSYFNLKRDHQENSYMNVATISR